MYTACISVFADLSRQAVRSVYVTRWKQLVANCRGWGWGGEVVVGGGGGEWGEGRGGGGGAGSTKSLRIKDSFGNKRKVKNSLF